MLAVSRLAGNDYPRIISKRLHSQPRPLLASAPSCGKLGRSRQSNLKDNGGSLLVMLAPARRGRASWPGSPTTIGRAGPWRGPNQRGVALDAAQSALMLADARPPEDGALLGALPEISCNPSDGFSRPHHYSLRPEHKQPTSTCSPATNKWLARGSSRISRDLQQGARLPADQEPQRPSWQHLAHEYATEARLPLRRADRL